MAHLVAHVLEEVLWVLVEKHLALQTDFDLVFVVDEILAQPLLEAVLAVPGLRVNACRVREARLGGAQREREGLLLRGVLGSWDGERPLQLAVLLVCGLLHVRLLLGSALLLLRDATLLAVVLALLPGLALALLALGLLLLVLRRARRR